METCRRDHDLSLPENQYIVHGRKADGSPVEIIECAACRHIAIREANAARRARREKDTP